MGDVNDRPPVKRRRSRSSSVQRMLDLEKKIRPWVNHGRSASEMSTASRAASQPDLLQMAPTLPELGYQQTPTWDPQEGDKDWKKAADKAAKAAKRASAQRLVKPPPSASRTPHLMARQPAPGPPTTGYSSQSERSSSYGPPDHASIDQGSRRSRRRSDSVNSITSVSSIASKIKASFDRPRGGALPR
ncbi:unnamed protein product, partial [Parascedosporium putredinis]